MKKYLTTYGKPRFLGIVSLEEEDYASIKQTRLIVVQSHRGEELAEVVGELDEEQEREYRMLKTVSEHGEGPVRGGDPVVTDLHLVRAPTREDIEHFESQCASCDGMLRIAQELVVQHKLLIKLIDAELLLDEKKLFFYFTSDQRVDFRTLVKDLARRFKTRIELRQMGVRDEARIIKGLSSCGLPCCCSYWLNQFAPIGIKMVKEQNIALNPAKISGICGRLMCCMSFEHKTYRELWSGLPGPGSKIKTPTGNFIVTAMDVAREAVRCHRPTGGDIVVPIGLFAEFKDAVMRGEDWEVPEDAISDFDRRKMERDCSACRNGFVFGSVTQPVPISEGAKNEKNARDGARRPRGEGRAGGETDHEQDAARRKNNRKRGRRGGQGAQSQRGQEGQSAQGGRENQNAHGNTRNAGENRHDAAGEPRRNQKSNDRQKTPQPQKPPRDPQERAAMGEVRHQHSMHEDGDKNKRPRRRRRRPPRPKGAEGSE